MSTKDGNNARRHAVRREWREFAEAVDFEARALRIEAAARWNVGSRGSDHNWQSAIVTQCDASGDVDGRNHARRKFCSTCHPSKRTQKPIIPRTISPTYGPAAFKTFNADSLSISAELGALMTLAVWPSIAGKHVCTPWFRDYCTSQLLQSAHCMLGLIYTDLLADRSRTHMARMYKANTIKLIQERVESKASFTIVEIEQLIFAILILSCDTLESRHDQEMALPFVPQRPTAAFFQLWGRVNVAELPLRTAFALIRRQGGLACLKLPGLACMAAQADLLRAASMPRKPLFPCFWNAHVVDMLPEEIDDEEFLTSPKRPGVGFAKLPRGLLSTQAASVFVELACLDRIVGTYQEREPVGAALETALDARNATLHRLLSLPHWDELEPELKSTSHRTIYETCRLTSVIYCNAAILSIPPHNGWNETYTDALIEIMSGAKLADWKEDVSALHLWSLMIGGMAAFRTDNRAYFEQSLRRYYITRRPSWASMLASLREFIWTDHACKSGGAAVLHSALFGSDRG